MLSHHLTLLALPLLALCQLGPGELPQSAHYTAAVPPVPEHSAVSAPQPAQPPHLPAAAHAPAAVANPQAHPPSSQLHPPALKPHAVGAFFPNSFAWDSAPPAKGSYSDLIAQMDPADVLGRPAMAVTGEAREAAEALRSGDPDKVKAVVDAAQAKGTEDGSAKKKVLQVGEEKSEVHL